MPRTNETFGYVNFPVTDPSYTNTKEGGMVVKLVVMCKPRGSKKWEIVLSPEVRDVRQLELVADDMLHIPNVKDYGDDTLTPEQYFNVMKQQYEFLDSVHYPHSVDMEKQYKTKKNRGFSVENFVSIPYKAVVIIGYTGWSGLNKKTDDYWKCTFNDLTDKGKELYNSLKALYKEHELRLLTFLDT
jgi:hypothetical protein